MSLYTFGLSVSDVCSREDEGSRLDVKFRKFIRCPFLRFLSFFFFLFLNKFKLVKYGKRTLNNITSRKQQEIEESVKPVPEKYKFELDLVKRLASGEEDPDHDKIIKELESESVVGQKARKLMQMTTQRLKKLVN